MPAFGRRAFGFATSVALLNNFISSSSALHLTSPFRILGWLIPTFTVGASAIVAALAALFLSKAIASLPGNKKFKFRIEFSRLASRLFPQWVAFPIAVTVIAVLSLSATHHIMHYSRLIDEALLRYSGKTCALILGGTLPQGGFCIDRSVVANGELPGIPFAGATIAISFGYLVTVGIAFPLSMLSLSDTLWLQVIAFFVRQVCGLVWTAQFVQLDAGVELPAIIDGTPLAVAKSEILPLAITLFAFVITLNSWLNEKSRSTQVAPAVITACSIAFVENVMLAAASAHGLPAGDVPANDISDMTVVLSTINGLWGISYAACIAFAIGQTVSVLPAYLIIARYNLLATSLPGGLCRRRDPEAEGSPPEERRVVPGWFARFTPLLIAGFLGLLGNSSDSIDSVIAWGAAAVACWINHAYPIVTYLVLRNNGSDRYGELPIEMENEEVVQQNAPSCMQLLANWLCCCAYADPHDFARRGGGDGGGPGDGSYGYMGGYGDGDSDLSSGLLNGSKGSGSGRGGGGGSGRHGHRRHAGDDDDDDVDYDYAGDYDHDDGEDYPPAGRRGGPRGGRRTGLETLAEEESTPLTTVSAAPSAVSSIGYLLPKWTLPGFLSRLDLTPARRSSTSKRGSANNTAKRTSAGGVAHASGAVVTAAASGGTVVVAVGRGSSSASLPLSVANGGRARGSAGGARGSGSGGGARGSGSAAAAAGARGSGTAAGSVARGSGTAAGGAARGSGTGTAASAAASGMLAFEIEEPGGRSSVTGGRSSFGASGRGSLGGGRGSVGGSTPGTAASALASAVGGPSPGALAGGGGYSGAPNYGYGQNYGHGYTYGLSNASLMGDRRGGRGSGGTAGRTSAPVSNSSAVGFNVFKTLAGSSGDLAVVPSSVAAHSVRGAGAASPLVRAARVPPPPPPAPLLRYPSNFKGFADGEDGAAAAASASAAGASIATASTGSAAAASLGASAGSSIPTARGPPSRPASGRNWGLPDSVSSAAVAERLADLAGGGGTRSVLSPVPASGGASAAPSTATALASATSSASGSTPATSARKAYAGFVASSSEDSSEASLHRAALARGISYGDAHTAGSAAALHRDAAGSHGPSAAARVAGARTSAGQARGSDHRQAHGHGYGYGHGGAIAIEDRDSTDGRGHADSTPLRAAALRDDGTEAGRTAASGSESGRWSWSGSLLGLFGLHAGPHGHRNSHNGQRNSHSRGHEHRNSASHGRTSGRGAGAAAAAGRGSGAAGAAGGGHHHDGHHHDDYAEFGVPDDIYYGDPAAAGAGFGDSVSAGALSLAEAGGAGSGGMAAARHGTISALIGGSRRHVGADTEAAQRRGCCARLCCQRRVEGTSTRLPMTAEEVVVIVPPSFRRRCCREQSVAVFMLVAACILGIATLVCQIVATANGGGDL